MRPIVSGPRLVGERQGHIVRMSRCENSRQTTHTRRASRYAVSRSDFRIHALEEFARTCMMMRRSQAALTSHHPKEHSQVLVAGPVAIRPVPNFLFPSKRVTRPRNAHNVVLRLRPKPRITAEWVLFWASCTRKSRAPAPEVGPLGSQPCEPQQKCCVPCAWNPIRTRSGSDTHPAGAW